MSEIGWKAEDLLPGGIVEKAANQVVDDFRLLRAPYRSFRRTLH
jgi:hypothetical protein